MYKILVISGGGIRGYLTLKVLSYIEKHSNKKIRDMFDLIVGTSSGAFIGAMLNNCSAQYLESALINSYLHDLFKPNKFSLGGFFKSKYNTESKLNIINEIVNTEYPNNYDYAAVAYDIKNSKPIIFNTLENEETLYYKLTTKYKMNEAVCASTAAPIYWDPYSLDNMILIDGALVSNNPVNIAVKLAYSKGKTLNDLYIVNITTGSTTRKYNLTTGNNHLKWMNPILNILMSSQSSAASLPYINEGLNYYKLDVPLIHASDDIDETSKANIKLLGQEADILIDIHQKNIEQIIKDIT